MAMQNQTPQNLHREPVRYGGLSPEIPGAHHFVAPGDEAYIVRLSSPDAIDPSTVLRPGGLFEAKVTAGQVIFSIEVNGGVLVNSHSMFR